MVLKYYQKFFGEGAGGERVGPFWSKMNTQPVSEFFFVDMTFDSFLIHCQFESFFRSVFVQFPGNSILKFRFNF